MQSWRSHTELLEPAEMARADAAAIRAGTPGAELMEAAGQAVARAALPLILPGSRRTPRIAVLCGPGNNGGDGFVAARRLAESGLDVKLFLLGARGSLKGDARGAADRWSGAVSPLEGFAPEPFDLVIDAIFGAGLTRNLDGDALAAVKRTNGWRRNQSGRVLAVDVPTGLDGRTGLVRGAAIEADATVTFFRLKPGHVLLPGRQVCGKLRLAQIGIGHEVLGEVQPRTSLNLPSLWLARLPRPTPAGHKYTRGHALVLSGQAGHTGAARLAARAALRIGAGLVTLAGSTAAQSDLAAHATAVMLAECNGPSDLVRLLADSRKNVLVLGPGLGVSADSEALVRVALTPGSRAVVLDADAISLLARDATLLATLRTGREGDLVLTPHEGEFSRLIKGLGGPIDADSHRLESDCEHADSKLERARAAARATRSVVLLKGADTVVASPDGRASIAADLPPDLATAGSGDVLAGMVGGLLAQGMPAYEAACAAVWLHGAAARSFGRGLIAEDLPEALPRVLADVSSWTDLTTASRKSRA